MRSESTVLGQPFWRYRPVKDGENGWESNNESNEDRPTEVETCDVTFVDDEALFLERKSPGQLEEDTVKVLAAVSSTFRRYGELDRERVRSCLFTWHRCNKSERRQTSTSGRESGNLGNPALRPGRTDGESLCVVHVQTPGYVAHE